MVPFEQIISSLICQKALNSSFQIPPCILHFFFFLGSFFSKSHINSYRKLELARCKIVWRLAGDSAIKSRVLKESATEKLYLGVAEIVCKACLGSCAQGAGLLWFHREKCTCSQGQPEAGDPEGEGLMTCAAHKEINRFYSSAYLGHLS